MTTPSTRTIPTRRLPHAVRAAAAGLTLGGLTLGGTVFAGLPAQAVAPKPVFEPLATAVVEYGYPHASAPDCDERVGSTRGCVRDIWGFYQGQCVSWVAHRLNSLNAFPMVNRNQKAPGHPVVAHWGSATNWGPAARRAGYRVGMTPSRGAVVWYSGTNGHVAYVEQVNRDGSVLISEMNHDGHNGFDLTTISRTNRWPKGFIHLKDLPAVPAKAGYRIDASGRLLAGTRAVGTGWRTMRLVTEVADLNHDNRPDLLAADSAGRLWLYATRGTGFAPRRQIGVGFGGVTQLADAGPMTGATPRHLVILTATGRLVRYRITVNGLTGATGLATNPAWTRIHQASDLNDDGRADLVMATRSGAMTTYRTSATGALVRA